MKRNMRIVLYLYINTFDFAGLIFSEPNIEYVV